MKRLSKLLLIFCSFFWVTSAIGVEKAALNGPVAFVPDAEYEFAKATESAEITHDFVIQNKGNVPLKVEKIKTG